MRLVARATAAEIDAGHRHHVERRGVMLGHVQAIDAGLVGGLDEGEPLVEQGGERPLAVLDVVEQPDFHFSSNRPILRMTGMSRLASASTNAANSGWSM